mmetsp:Transcript_14864/g.56335  ORF Transcript_14864/g.56335 Transcript_14864/m.56335 type:complete len:293 (-) Transcript_14864:233-1111(-)
MARKKQVSPEAKQALGRIVASSRTTTFVFCLHPNPNSEAAVLTTKDKLNLLAPSPVLAFLIAQRHRQASTGPVVLKILRGGGVRVNVVLVKEQLKPAHGCVDAPVREHCCQQHLRCFQALSQRGDINVAELDRLRQRRQWAAITEQLIQVHREAHLTLTPGRFSGTGQANEPFAILVLDCEPPSRSLPRLGDRAASNEPREEAGALRNEDGVVVGQPQAPLPGGTLQLRLLHISHGRNPSFAKQAPIHQLRHHDIEAPGRKLLRIKILKRHRLQRFGDHLDEAVHLVLLQHL